MAPVLDREDPAVLLLNEPLHDLPDALRAEGIDVHISTGLRWIHRGAGGVCLAALRVGDRWRTSREAVRRFLLARSAAARRRRVLPGVATRARSTPATRAAALAAVDGLYADRGRRSSKAPAEGGAS